MKVEVLESSASLEWHCSYFYIVGLSKIKVLLWKSVYFEFDGEYLCLREHIFIIFINGKCGESPCNNCKLFEC